MHSLVVQTLSAAKAYGDRTFVSLAPRAWNGRRGEGEISQFTYSLWLYLVQITVFVRYHVILSEATNEDVCSTGFMDPPPYIPTLGTYTLDKYQLPVQS